MLALPVPRSGEFDVELGQVQSGLELGKPPCRFLIFLRLLLAHWTALQIWTMHALSQRVRSITGKRRGQSCADLRARFYLPVVA